MVRKRVNKILFISLFVIFSAFTGGNDFSTLHEPGSVYKVVCGNIVMKISSKGGRIISFNLGGKEFMTSERENENFGSTLWTAPQSDWGWPPYAVLDIEEYSVEKTGRVLKMTSKPDLKSGFQVEKSWEPVCDKYVQIKYLIRNISENEKSVGPWEVSRVPVGGLAFFPDGEDGKVPDSKLKAELRRGGINWLSFKKPAIPDHLKLFSTAKEGWLAYAFEGILFIKEFPDTHVGNYSPQQGEVEIYINKDRTYIELENHGEYKRLQPGESLTYMVRWYLLPIPENIKTVKGNKELVSLTRKQLEPVIIKVAI